jgi:GT2 family glycosyltransferase
VLNGVSRRYGEAVEGAFAANPQVVLTRLAQNQGSQGGFDVALDAALHLTPPATHVLLLDDDDVLGEDTIDRAFDVLEDLAEGAVLSIGKVRGDYSDVDVPADVKRSSFLNFDLAQAVGRRLDRMRRTTRPARDKTTAVSFAPYGGLLLPRAAAIALVGREAPEYVVYEDDIYKTWWLTTHGYLLNHTATAVMKDVSIAWQDPDSKRRGRISSLLSGSPNFRSYYYVRNRAHFEKTFWRQSILRYQVNRFVVIFTFLLGCTARRNQRQLRHLLGAIRDGEKGLLGVNPRYPLP